MINIAINGFGRIGRRVFRLIADRADMQVVAINDLADSKTLTHLLKYDSIHGQFSQKVEAGLESIIINGREIPLTNYTHPKDLDWSAHPIDFVIECTGRFKTKTDLEHHLTKQNTRVILSAPPLSDDIKTIIWGINDGILSPEDRIISNASCTTHNAAPMIKIIDDLCGVKQAYITTVHSYTTDQSLHDQPHKDLRRARAAGQSIVPTTTGAAKALTKIFPKLENVIGGCGIRVPVANGSLTDITCNVQDETDIESINEAFKEAAEKDFHGILQYTEDPIVSVDIVGNSHSCIFDSQMTSVIGNMVKILGWYDNETGYSSRILDIICNLSKKYALLSNK